MVIVVRFSALTAALCACLIALASLAGSTQPPAPQLAVLHLDQCALPCWLNIQPGVTPFEEAVRRVTLTNPGSFFTSAYELSVMAAYQVNAALLQVGIYANEQGLVNRITIITSNLEPIPLGDVLAYSGTPNCLEAHTAYAVYATDTAEALVIGSGTVENRNLWGALNNISIRLRSAEASPCPLLNN